ncbi:myosin heavy chain, clone 203 [Drosophila tropicalis]|uniref:myosin heavy chain, clone 203 n=1 Tax=Drosophila tropicalis TaxID=46794 RepID=UPI0035AB6A81
MLAPLDDSKDNLLERLGDCASLPLHRIDLIKRTLRCRKIEIFDYEEDVSFSAEEEEGEGLTFTTEDATDDEERAQKVVKEIDCLIHRIELIQLAIKKRQEEQKQKTEEKEAEAEEVELVEEVLIPSKLAQCLRKREMQEENNNNELETNLVEEPKSKVNNLKLSCQEEKEVNELMYAHDRLQCELDETICRYQNLRHEFQGMRLQLSAIDKKLGQLQDHAKDHIKWTKQVAGELNVCSQRFKHLEKVKLSNRNAARVIDSKLTLAFNQKMTYLQDNQYKYDLKDFNREIAEMCCFVEDLRSEIEFRCDKLERSVAKQSTHDNGMRGMTASAVLAMQAALNEMGEFDSQASKKSPSQESFTRKDESQEM